MTPYASMTDQQVAEAIASNALIDSINELDVKIEELQECYDCDEALGEAMVMRDYLILQLARSKRTIKAFLRTMGVCE